MLLSERYLKNVNQSPTTEKCCVKELLSLKTLKDELTTFVASHL